jgi:hypothetical protein
VAFNTYDASFGIKHTVRVGKWCGSMGQHSPRGCKINILNKKLIVCAQQILSY